MQWTGKIVGGALGLAFGPVGVAIGSFVGHQYDLRAGGAGSVLQIGQQFFRATFLVMGHVAKSDGRITQREIEAARATMASLRLSPAQTQQAIALFTAGKRPDFDLDETLGTLRQLCGGHSQIIRMFLEIQVRAALSGNDAAAVGLQGPVRASMARVAGLLGVSPAQLGQLEAALRYYGRQAPGTAEVSTEERLAGAYRALEIEATADNAQVVKSYRRLMSRHHPDKLKANGLPESMLEHAKQRTQQIREAYEYIKDRRGMA